MKIIVTGKDNEMLQIKIKQREEQERAWVEAQEANRRYVVLFFQKAVFC